MKIKVLCCDPEKIRDKICCKGCGVIKSIEIVEPPKPKSLEKKEGDEKPGHRPPARPPPAPEKPKEKPPKSTTPPPPDQGAKPTDKPDMPKARAPEKPPEPILTLPPLGPIPVCPPRGPVGAVPVGICYVPYYEGRPGGPCFQGYCGPPICYDGYYGRPVYDSYGGGRPCYVTRFDQYFSDENPSSCSIM